MKKRVKNLLSVFGVLLTLGGVTMAIPFYLNKIYFGLIMSFVFVIIGIILLSIAFGE